MTTAAFQKTADYILAKLEEGTAPWSKEWRANGGDNMSIKGHTYSGWNQFACELEAALKGYSSKVWMTFAQAKEAGGKVRKGSKSIVLVRPLIREDKETKEERFVGWGWFRVFNADCIEGEIKLPETEANDNDNAEIADCEQIVSAFFSKQSVSLSHGGDRAYYRSLTDEIRMPEMKTFTCSETYYATLFHEMAHATGAKTRLNRENLVNPNLFGSHEYGQEELVAEFASSFVCGQCGIEKKTIDNSAAYLAGWKKNIKANPEIVLKSVGQAMKAAAFIMTAGASAEETEAA